MALSNQKVWAAKPEASFDECLNQVDELLYLAVSGLTELVYP
jgi:hypothetical protein